MGSSKRSNIVHRIEQKLDTPSLVDKLSNELSSSDFNSLLTETFARRAERITPDELLRRYTQNVYAQPAACDAVSYRRLELDMLLAAQERGIDSLILSPASLFGCCSALGLVSQNRVISATRNLEILSDATNMLALYIAAGIKDGSLSHANDPIHLCSSHRHIRYQAELGESMLPHFGIFTLVSAGRSRSSYAFEVEAFLFHLRFYSDYWQQKHMSPLSLSLNRRQGYKDSEGFFERIVEAVKKNLPDMEVFIDERENSTAYYKGLQATLSAAINGSRAEVGDIGFTDWTQQLLNNPGERLLISAMALDRQVSV